MELASPVQVSEVMTMSTVANLIASMREELDRTHTAYFRELQMVIADRTEVLEKFSSQNDQDLNTEQRLYGRVKSDGQQ